MIQRCFRLLDRVGPGKEEMLHRAGIATWDDFLGRDDVPGIGKAKKPYLDRQLRAAKRALHLGETAFFSSLPSSETWRLYAPFSAETRFLDIEVDHVTGDLTVVGVFDGLATKTMIAGINLNIDALREELAHAKLLVTFNGASFDLPFLRKRYAIVPDVPHVDVRHLCSRVGLVGGLKEIEKELDIKRPSIIDSLSGGDPLSLWKMYRATGDEHYLHLLVEYNEQDCVSLQKILRECIHRLKSVG